MSQPEAFTATYIEYQMNTERLALELDRLSDQAELVEGRVQETVENVDRLLGVAMRIEKGVQQAITAWGDGSDLVKQTSAAAQNAALSGVQEALNALISKVGAATVDAQSAALQLKNTQRRMWSSFIGMASVFLAGAVVACAVTYYGLKGGFITEEERAIQHQSDYFLHYWSNATDTEKKAFQAIISRPRK